MRHLSSRGARTVLVAALLLPVLTSASSPPTNTSSEAPHSALEEQALSTAAQALARGADPLALATCLPLATQEEIDPVRAKCRFVAAAASLRSGSPAQVESLLPPALDGLGPLRPWALVLLADARLEAASDEPVLPLIQEARAIDARGPLAHRASALEALHWLQDPERAGAAEAIARLLDEGHGDGPRLRLALARHLLAEEKKEAAKKHLLTLWSRHPERDEAEVAWTHLEAIGASPGWPEIRARTERFLALGQARKALATLGDRKEPEALFLRGRALMDAGERAEAEASFARYLETSPANAAETKILLGRIAARREDLAQAVEHLDEAARLGKGREAAEAAFLAAFLHYDFGALPQAVARFDAYAKAYGHRRDEAHWFRGWAHFLQDEYAEAERAFARGAEGSLGLQMLYWRGRAAEKLGREDEAREIYRRVLSKAPTDWYGLLAARRIEAEPPALNARPAEAGRLGPKGIRRDRLERAEALYAVGWLAAAGEEFDAAVAGKPSADFLRAAARLALRSGDPHRAYRLSWRLGGLRSASDLAYPRAFPEALEAAAASSGVDAHLLLAIARQESGFSSTVRSPRGAVGLMQLLPTTARKMAARLETAPDPARLEDPWTNLELGAAYLAALLERFGQHPCLAVAAYNAGPAAVAGWQSDPLRKELELDAWVESIPWRETRNYVKVVMGNWATFRALETKGAPSFAPKLPAPKDGIDF